MICEVCGKNVEDVSVVGYVRVINPVLGSTVGGTRMCAKCRDTWGEDGRCRNPWSDDSCLEANLAKAEKALATLQQHYPGVWFFIGGKEVIWTMDGCCIVCGKPLGIFKKWSGALKHSKCEFTREAAVP